MAGFILGEKSIQSQTFNEKGERIPTTFIHTSPCFLVAVKDVSQKYLAIKLGFGVTKNIKKSVRGELTKAGIKTPLRFIKEFRIEKYGTNVTIVNENNKQGIKLNDQIVFVGAEVKPSVVFKKGEKVNIAGMSKGKGFQGVVTRHKFAGGPRTHGQSDRERAPGSIGMTTTPGRIFKGKRMAGHMGFEKVTIKNLLIVDVKDDGMLVKGLIPGSVNGYVEVKTNYKTI